MSKIDYQIFKGLIKAVPVGSKTGNFSTYRMFKHYADSLKMPYFDCFCDATKTDFPVRFNSTSGSAEYFNGTSWVSFDDSGSVSPAVTAFAGGGQGSATALTNAFSNVSVSVTAGDSVKLPAAIAGKTVTIKNNGATAIDVFPATGDSINALAVNTAIRIAPKAEKSFTALDATVWQEDQERVTATAGTVSLPSFSFNTNNTNGIYSVSSTQTGFATAGVLVGGFNAAGLFTDAITEQTAGAGIELSKNTIQQRTATAVNVTGTVSAAAIVGGLITSTSAAGVTVTLDTAVNIAAAASAVRGTSIDFLVDNSAGASVVTVAVGAGITAVTAVITGGATLTVAAGAVGQFRLLFTSATIANLARII